MRLFLGRALLAESDGSAPWRVGIPTQPNLLPNGEGIIRRVRSAQELGFAPLAADCCEGQDDEYDGDDSSDHYAELNSCTVLVECG